MKHSANQLTRAYIHDNKQFVNGNVAEHLMLNIEAWIKENFDYDITEFEY